MPKRIDFEKDIEVLNYLKEHTYKVTAAYFQISEKQITRIKARSQSIQPSAPEPEAKILEGISGQTDREKDEEPIAPERIEIPEPQEPQGRKEKPALEEPELGKITIIKLMSIYEQLTGKSAPRTKGTTKNTIRNSIIAILNREPL
jgi:hypothetical protein